MVGCVLIGNFINVFISLHSSSVVKLNLFFNSYYLQSLLQYEIVKSDYVVADSCKIFVVFIKSITVKLKILNCKIKLLNNTYIYMCVCVCV
jgi:hypothetical protein